MIRITNRSDSIVLSAVCLGLMATFYTLLSAVFLSLIESHFNARISKIIPANFCFVVELIMSAIFVGLIHYVLFAALFIRDVFLIGNGVFIRWVEIAGVQRGQICVISIADIHKLKITEYRYRGKTTRYSYDVSCNYDTDEIWLATFSTEPEAEKFVEALKSSKQ